MGKGLVEKLLKTIAKMEWPTTPISTGQGRQTYEVGIEQLQSYQGDPETLSVALNTFQSGDSQPYAFAGVAHTLVLASKGKNATPAQAGLKAAMKWLEKAQACEPDIVEINIVEALIYICGNQFDNARVVLDYLQQQDPMNHQLHLAEIAFWQGMQGVEETLSWFEQATDSALTIPQRLRVRARLADYLLSAGMLDDALGVYKEAVHFDKANAKLWHNLSLIYWKKQDFDEAERCNRMALRHKEIPAARKLEAALKKQKGNAGIKQKLFGR